MASRLKKSGAVLAAAVALVSAWEGVKLPAVGDPIYAKGNPSNMDFITVYGRIAGKERSAGLWKSVVITDIATVPGQSGGPVFDQHGRVIGITVGVMLAPSGFTRSIVGIGYVVPGQAICGLMARV